MNTTCSSRFDPREISMYPAPGTPHRVQCIKPDGHDGPHGDGRWQWPTSPEERRLAEISERLDAYAHGAKQERDALSRMHDQDDHALERSAHAVLVKAREAIGAREAEELPAACKRVVALLREAEPYLRSIGDKPAALAARIREDIGP